MDPSQPIQSGKAPPLQGRKERPAKKTFTYEEARATAITTGDHLRFNGDEPIDIGLAVANLPDDVPKEMIDEESLSSRTIFHLIRLLNKKRTPQERNFGLALLNHRECVLESIQTEEPHTKGIFCDRIDQMLAGEGESTTMFWTFAPYLYHELLPLLGSEAETVKRILLWIIDGTESSDHSSPVTNGYSGKVDLLGLDNLDMGYYLSNNPEDASHKFTHQEAKKIVRKYLADSSWERKQTYTSKIHWA